MCPRLPGTTPRALTPSRESRIVGYPKAEAEDPSIHEEFEAELAKQGVECRMAIIHELRRS